MMIKPANFGFNAQTAVNNSFQSKSEEQSKNEIRDLAIAEFENMVEKLRVHGVNVKVVEDTPSPIKPDSIFPNNWISFHKKDTLITYPMFAENRRIERRQDIISEFEEQLGYSVRYKFEFYEEENLFLEGTGSMILDRDNKIVYACISPRTNISILDKFCVLMGYRKQIFHSYDSQGQLIYHTNVMMCVARDFVIVCLESIQSEDEEQELINVLESTGKTIIEISLDQVNQFAGNMLQLRTNDMSDILVMSQSAYQSLEAWQIDKIREHTKILAIGIPTIEKYGGGSVRCMMAEIF
jgi:hypothetical protein